MAARGRMATQGFVPVLTRARIMIPALAATLGATSAADAKPQVYVDFPSAYLPASPTQHPRILIGARIAELQALYAEASPPEAVGAFQHDIEKLMDYTSAEQDWHAESGWPAAALALHWLITGDAASGQKACDLYLPHFTGASAHNQETNLYYALAYDWLYHHPCFTEAMKADLRAKLVAWSDSTAAGDEEGTWIAHDTDRNISATAGHFLGGLAIVGEDHANGMKLLTRGWTGWKTGLNASDDLPDFPVAEFFRTTTQTGIPLPGWDYGMMSDVHMAQNLFFAMDELGIIDAEFADTKKWWVNSLLYFMHSVDPANTHYRWIGDQQTDVHLNDYTGYVYGYLSNCVYLTERYGFTQEAAMGRSFLDSLARPSYGVADGDTMLWLLSAWPASAARVDYHTQAPRYVIGGIGPDQHMGIGMFRSEWSASADVLNSKQVTWGGFYGIGSYIADHMHNIAGSFWLWRNGEYLLTEPVNYGGNTAAVYPATMWNSLSIPNEAVPNDNESTDNGGPIVYFNEGSAYIEGGRADAEASVFYARLNADKSYDVPENPWAECTGSCRQPVSKYTRSFAYDGLTNQVVLIDRVDLERTRPVGLRFRTQNQGQLPTQVEADTVSIPSEQGSYRTLVRVLSPTPASAWVIEQEPWTPESWQIDTSMIGSQARLDFPSAMEHRVVTVLHAGSPADGDDALSDATVIGASPDLLGACAKTFCFLVPYNHIAAPLGSLRYQTPASMAAHARHLVTDLEAESCYVVNSSAGGEIASQLPVRSEDNSILFEVPTAGVQEITIEKTTPCDIGADAGVWGGGDAAVTGDASGSPLPPDDGHGRASPGNASEDSGCSCAIPGGRKAGSKGLVLLLAAAAIALRKALRSLDEGQL